MQISLRLFTGSILIVCKMVRFFRASVFFYRRAKKVPKVNNTLLTLSATQLAHSIRRKEIKSVDLVEAYIARIKEVNPLINSVAEDRFEEALKDAEKIDDLLASNQIPDTELITKKPLLGIPVTIKENINLKGLSSTLCSEIHRNDKAKEDADAVKLLKEAGAIPLLVSTTPEYCICMETYSKMFGVSRNPYNSLRVVGGSSGGEGALLGAGASVIGIGSDLAGSIRFPSTFNGIFGHKPTHGYIPLKGSLPNTDDPYFIERLTLGPMCRYAEDLRLMMKVLSPDPQKLRLDEKVNLNDIRIFYMEDCGSNFGLMSVQREIKEKMRQCATYFKDNYKSEISNVKFKNLEVAQEICSSASYQMQYIVPLRTAQGNYSTFWQLLINTFNLSKFCQYIMVHDIVDKVTKATPASVVKTYMEKLDELKQEMATELGRNGVFFYPAFPTTAPRHREFMAAYAGVHYAFIVNILGFPSTTVPLGLDRNGLPVCIQVIANVNEDRLCLAVAEELQKAFGGWTPPS